jgi:hypothetical protein
VISKLLDGNDDILLIRDVENRSVQLRPRSYYPQVLMPLSMSQMQQGFSVSLPLSRRAQRPHAHPLQGVQTHVFDVQLSAVRGLRSHKGLPVRQNVQLFVWLPGHDAGLREVHCLTLPAHPQQLRNDPHTMQEVSELVQVPPVSLLRGVQLPQTDPAGRRSTALLQ